jgi:phosphate transport system substrate-binding protein
MVIRDNYEGIQTLAINGIEPSRQTIVDRTYPYVTEVYAVIRSDLSQNSLAYKLYEWLQSKDGKEAIKESGYIPIQ